ncbi:hypothetical protein ACEOHC_003883 [Salmonella enterica]
MSATLLKDLEERYSDQLMAQMNAFHGLEQNTPNLDRKMRRLRVGRGIYPRGKAYKRVIWLESFAAPYLWWQQ